MAENNKPKCTFVVTYVNRSGRKLSFSCSNLRMALKIIEKAKQMGYKPIIHKILNAEK